MGARAEDRRAAKISSDKCSLKIQEFSMFKRLATAAIGMALALQLTPALAAPDHSVPKEAEKTQEKPQEPKRVGGGSRKGLTPKALALLDRIETKFGPVNVISGYRPGARIAGSGRVSRHASGNAIDFEAGGRKGAIVQWLIANHKSGGTMTYAAMSHIHVDIGQHFVSLGSGSGRGYKVSSRSRSRDRDAARYASEGYSRRYAGERRYSGERRGRSSRGGYARAYQGQRYASGYATIYQ
jgi:hypothetical protein